MIPIHGTAKYKSLLLLTFIVSLTRPGTSLHWELDFHFHWRLRGGPVRDSSRQDRPPDRARLCSAISYHCFFKLCRPLFSAKCSKRPFCAIVSPQHQTKRRTPFALRLTFFLRQTFPTEVWRQQGLRIDTWTGFTLQVPLSCSLACVLWWCQDSIVTVIYLFIFSKYVELEINWERIYLLSWTLQLRSVVAGALRATVFRQKSEKKKVGLDPFWVRPLC